MASIVVSGSAAVYYDCRTLYPGATIYSVEDTLENYQKYVADAADGLVTISTPFNNVANFTEEKHLSKTVDFSSGTNGATGTHRIFEVTGTVQMKLMAKCTTDLVGSANTAVIALGTDKGSSGFIAATSAEVIDAGEYWYTTSSTAKDGAFTSLVLDKIVSSGNVGYEIGTAKISTGVIEFHCSYIPWDATGNVSLGNLSAMV